MYSYHEISASSRATIPKSRATVYQLDNRFWEPGDEWIENDSGYHVDAMFRSVSWIEEQLDRVLKQYQASIGYTTCFWYNVLRSKILFDRNGWFAELQKECDRPYPDGLKDAIIAKNLPLLEDLLSSYTHQIELAERRDDPISVNHRITAFLASYFDVLFAMNRLPHPGEKRLLQYTSKHCRIIPEKMDEGVRNLISSGSPVAAKQLVRELKKLL